MEAPIKGVRIESFVKADRLLTPAPNRSLVFETERQRNVAFLDKGISKPGRITFEVLRRAAQSVHIARICINTLKEKVSKTKWIIKYIDAQKQLKNNDDKRILEVTDFFKNPNKNDTFREFIDKVLEDLLILDSVCVEKTRYPNGTLAELHFVDAATIRPVFDEHGNQDIEIPIDTREGRVELPVSYVQVLYNSQYGGPESGEIIAAWPKKDFMNFHMHPQGSMEGIGYGLSPLEGVLSVVANILNADNYNGTYFEEGSFPPVILQILGNINQRDIQAYREYLQAELNGNFHRPAIFGGGTQKMEAINLKDLTNRDMEFMEYMKFMSRLLAAAYGLAGQDIGLTDDLNRSTSETQKDISSQKGYSSILHLLKEQFSEEIISKDFGYTDLEFDWVADDNIDPKDLAELLDKQLRAGIITLNEARQKSGYIAFDEWADVPSLLTTDGYTPLKMSDKENPENISDEPVEEIEEKNEKQEEKVDQVKSEEVYSVQNDEKKTKKSMFRRIWDRVTKSDELDNFQDTPVLFGSLITDDLLKAIVSDIFAKRDAERAKSHFEMASYSYQLNQSSDALREFISTHPHSYGGILLVEDDTGIRYEVYIKDNE